MSQNSDDTSLNKGTTPSKKDQLVYVIAIFALALSLSAVAVALVSSQHVKDMDVQQVNATEINDRLKTHEQVIQRLASAIYNQTQINSQQSQFNLDVVNFAKNVTATIHK